MIRKDSWWRGGAVGGGGNFLTGSRKEAKGQFYYTANVRERAADAGLVLGRFGWPAKR